MSLTILLAALLGISLFTNLTVQGIKKLLEGFNVKYSANVLAAVVAVVLSVCSGVGYMIYTDTAFNLKIAVLLLAFIYLSFLVSTNGYDKVVQAITQLKNNTEGE